MSPEIDLDANQLDASTFEQILEMDDDEDRDFSKTIVYEFFTQAKETFEKMDKSLYDDPFPNEVSDFPDCFPLTCIVR